MTGTTEVDRPAPLFFLSYARTGRSSSHITEHELDRQVGTFFDDLSDNVSGLVARRPGADPGFMDTSIPSGTHWTRELLQALGACRVFIPLLCGPYISSEWCGMEWYAFSQRMVSFGSEFAHQTPIIPVIWAPYPRNLTPQAVQAIQHFSPDGMPNVDVVGEYEKYGVSGLMWLRLDNSYRGVVWRLAQRIADFHHNYEVESSTFRKEELLNIFEEPSP